MDTVSKYTGISVITPDNFHALCDLLAARDKDLQQVINRYGYPPFWSRNPGFPTLVHIILEQQVSLASALAAMEKLKNLVDLTPVNILSLSDQQLRDCYFSRRKSLYVRQLSSMLLDGSLNLEEMNEMSDEEVIESLKRVKGIGNWTADIYLMMALHRTDRFPLGDVALVKSFTALKNAGGISRDEMEGRVAEWKPYRTIAAYLLWHAYLCKRTTKRRRH